jgi:hypothetical protein
LPAGLSVLSGRNANGRIFAKALLKLAAPGAIYKRDEATPGPWGMPDGKAWRIKSLDACFDKMLFERAIEGAELSQRLSELFAFERRTHAGLNV